MLKRNGKIVQCCFVVDDIDEAIGRWVKETGAGPFYIIRHMNDLEIQYKGRPARNDVSLAIGQAGDVQWEVIQAHGDNENVFTDMYPKGSGHGFHHFASIVDDFDQTIAGYVDDGHELTVHGMFGRSTKFAYLDFRKTLDCYVEIIENTDEIRNMFDRVAAASVAWDGTRPIRPFSELVD
jgi:hypothetical protein